MQFLKHNGEKRKAVLLVHGMGNTSTLFDSILEYLDDYCVIVCELDGHSSREKSEFTTVSDECEKIEEYVKREFDGALYGVLGFSLGGTIVVELLGRGNIKVEKAIIDAGFNIKMGFMTLPFKWMFQGSIWCIKNNIPVPKSLVESIMGEGNSGIMETIFKGVSIKSIGTSSMSCYTYEMPEGLREYKNPVVYWHGSNEPYPVKSARLLKEYLPQLEVRVFDDMGHGQMLHEHPKEYASNVLEFLGR